MPSIKRATTPFSAAAHASPPDTAVGGKEFKFFPGVRVQRAYPPRRTSLIGKIAAGKVSCKDF
jgi:hypothetical protein